jgi:drug/metabolite transporter (DMT)-like permease
MAVLALVLTCAFWGLSFPVLKALQLEQAARLPEASSWFLAAWIQLARFGTAAVLLTPALLHLPRPTRKEVQQGLELAAWGGLGMGIQTDGLVYTEASTSAFLTQAYCVLLPLWTVARSRRLPSLRLLGATALVVAGTAVLSGIRPGHLSIGRGELETLLSTVFFTGQILALEKPRYAENRGRPVTLMMCVGIAVLALPVAWLTAPAPEAMLIAGASLPTAAMLTSLAVFCTIGAFLLMNTFQRFVPATEAGLIYTSEPVFASAYALFLPALLATWAGIAYENERFTLALLAGGGAILAANLWMQWKGTPHWLPAWMTVGGRRKR